jgi:hypothetical protein
MCIFFEKQPLTPVRHTPFVPSLAKMLAVRCQAYGTTLPKAWQESAIGLAKQVDSREKFGGINNYCYLCRYKTKKV